MASTAACNERTLREWYGLSYAKDGFYFLSDYSVVRVESRRRPATDTTPATCFFVTDVCGGLDGELFNCKEPAHPYCEDTSVTRWMPGEIYNGRQGCLI